MLVKLVKPLDVSPFGNLPIGTEGQIVDYCPHTGAMSFVMAGLELAVMPEDTDTLACLRIINYSKPRRLAYALTRAAACYLLHYLYIRA